MKISSNAPLNDVRELTLYINSADLHFKWTMTNPVNDNCDLETISFRDSRWAHISFRDTQELEIFIDALDRFRDATVRRFGDWRET